MRWKFRGESEEGGRQRGTGDGAWRHGGREGDQVRDREEHQGLEVKGEAESGDEMRGEARRESGENKTTQRRREASGLRRHGLGLAGSSLGTA
eukprot:599361-Rhodomonas_salina.1